MQLPKSLTTVTTFSKIFAGLLFITFPILGFYLGRLYQHGKTTCFPQQQIGIEDKALEKELNYCLEDKAIIGKETEEEYSFPNFGIISSLLNQNKVQVIPYSYKRNIIKAKAINNTEQIDNHRWGITAWSLDKYVGYFKNLQNFTAPMSINNFPSFDGYENNGTPKWLQDRVDKWTDSKDYYTNINGIKMYRSQDGLGMSTSTNLEFFNPYSPSGKPTLYLLWVNENLLECEPVSFDDPCVLKEEEKAKEIVQRIADTISLKQ